MDVRENSQNNPWYISWGSSNYNGEAIDTLTPIHKSQQIHKYTLGLFVTGIIALVAALLTIILISVRMATGNVSIAPGISTTSMIFLITLFIDIVFTINLNRYINDKKPLILYIPCCILMLAFSVPQLIAVIAIFGINVPQNVIQAFENLSWANYITIVVCIVYMVAELFRMIAHRNDLDLKQEIKNVLK